ncbi:MAG: hypothetical protein OXC80_12535 [Gammaproteobacteria bacterium]|nr:hypothetical protein [Gammaproteobacteria bacterium]
MSHYELSDNEKVKENAHKAIQMVESLDRLVVELEKSLTLQSEPPRDRLRRIYIQTDLLSDELREILKEALLYEFYDLQWEKEFSKDKE